MDLGGGVFKKISVPPRMSSTFVVIATRLWVDKTPGGDYEDAGPRTTRSTAGCRLAAPSCYVSAFLPFKTK